MTCNNFGVSVNKNESDSGLLFTFQIEKKISDLKSEIDSKYLDENEADRLFVNEPISENIDMKNKKIINSGLPKDFGDLTNKQYVDNKFIEKETLVHFQNKNEETFARKVEIPKYPLQNTKLENMLIYYNIGLTHKPKVWLSSKFLNGLFPKLKKTVGYTGFEDIMGNKVVSGPIPSNLANNAEEGSGNPSAIYAENISLAGQPYGPA